MVFLISLILAVLLAVFCGDFLRRHSNWFYLGTAVVALFVIVCSYSGLVSQFPNFVYNWIYPIFSRSALSASMFILVMYAGAVPNGSAAMKKLMPVRAQLSIMASILTLAHNIVYARTYFRALFVSPAALSWNMLAASIISLIMIAIMLPLFVTSFPAVRRKVKPKSWKKLQRFAYGFYGLMYVHVLLVCLPGLKSGQASYLFTVAIYSVIFLGYAAMRVMKALEKKKLRIYIKKLPAALAACAFVVVCCLSGVQVYQASAAYGSALADSQEEDADETDGAEETDELENSDDGDSQSEVLLADESEDETDVDGADETEDTANTDETSDAGDSAAAASIDSGSDSDSSSTDNSGTSSDSSSSGSSSTGSSSTGSSSSGSSSSGSTSSDNSSSGSTSSDSSNSSGSSDSSSTNSTDTSTEEAQTSSAAEEETTTTVYKDGTYTGTSTSGYEGETITVTLTISNDTLTAFSATTDQLDTSYFDRALNYVKKKLLADITSTKTCSGATKSSNGILEATQNALAQAKN